MVGRTKKGITLHELITSAIKIIVINNSIALSQILRKVCILKIIVRQGSV